MKTNTRAYATLSIQSTELTAAEISDSFQVRGSFMQEAGFPVSSRKGSAVAEHSTWQLSSRSEENVNGLSENEQSINDHLAYILRFLESNSFAITNLASSCDVEIWCLISFAQSRLGFELSPDLLSRVSKFSIPIIFDIYASVEE